MEINTGNEINLWLIIGLAIFVVLFFLARYLFNYFYTRTKHFKQSIFLVRLPKEKPKDDGQGQSVQSLREDIARGETIFNTIGGLRAQGGLIPWIFGRDDHFCFEIVAHGGKISFYFAAPTDKALYLEQQINAHYPEASIEEVSDYNAFDSKGIVGAGFMMPKRDYIFPFKDYTEMEADAMNSLINVMSKLNDDESLTVQYTMRSANKAWHRRMKEMVEKAQRQQSTKEIYRLGGSVINGAVNFIVYHLIVAIFQSFEPKEAENKERPKELTEKEREMLKKMEEKNSKAGLDVNLRVIACSADKLRIDTLLNNVSDAYSEYNYYQYGNSFSKLNRNDQTQTISHFINRRFIESQSFLLNTQEMVSIFHLPLPHTETPNIDWLTSKMAPAPTNLPNDGIILGYNVYRGVKTPIRYKKEDRRRHAYLIGKSGTGKSVELFNMAIQDIQNGEGVCVMDPNGDLIEDLLNAIPPERAEDVIVFSPGDVERPLGLNLLEYDPRYPEQKSFVINEMINIFDKLYDLKATGGPMFEQYMRNALLLIMDDPETGSTLMEIPKVLADENFRRLKLSKCKNVTVIDFWTKEAEKAGGEAALANMVPYITSKLTPFISNDMMRPIIGQQTSAFNIRDIMDNKKILMVDLPKGAIGETNAYLLGMIIVGKILMGALSRTDMAQEDRKDFYLYIDEFQNFTTDSICQILSEARKYALSLNIAHQYIGQLSKNGDEKIKEAIFGNVGTMVSFKVGSEDAEFLVKDFGPVFNEYDLVNVGRGGFIKLLVDGQTTRPFSFQTIWPRMGQMRPGMADKIRSLSRYKFGQDKRIADYEILKRWGIKKEESPKEETSPEEK